MDAVELTDAQDEVHTSARNAKSHYTSIVSNVTMSSNVENNRCAMGLTRVMVTFETIDVQWDL